MLLAIAALVIALPSNGATDRPEGDGHAATLGPLTFSADQAGAGRTKFLSTCVLCHKADLSGGFGPPLRGSVFTQKWFPGSVSALFSFIKTNMPRNAPGTLSNAEVSALIAFISSENGKTAGDVALPSDLMALAGIGFDQLTSSASP
ncbi:cytochrome c [Mesorhizobium sp. B292B1B]|nr:cytochrome c [Mesorhizobium sp. B264B2A]MCA0008875.1 cytochrome c [Mesorhizobium sp. B264B1B]MCA0015404.1 cytochrome c [Mesorhizobium sp. B294B1A1]MCA0020362.1 cytochrome c [Mesorhizobium sp. B264B1A]MCA0024005.1 cytochrome c [Mesorhizobium sp. B263B1A]MCA0034602.1 cytochrome c [Mesorhizobium sp. B263B2A]MCA0041320.1 cytochrome c [Mesorhizobium sp. B292B1B]MCA0055540.1 cytochrome c [Mesorhizobium sp. B261B1A]